MLICFLLILAACANPPPVTQFEPTLELIADLRIESAAYRSERFPSRVAVVIPDTLIPQAELHKSKQISTGLTIQTALISAVKSAYEHIDVMRETPGVTGNHQWIVEFILHEPDHENVALKDYVVTPSMYGGATTYSYEGELLIYRQAVTMRFTSATGAERDPIKIAGTTFFGGRRTEVDPEEFAAAMARCYQQISDRIGAILVVGYLEE